MLAQNVGGYSKYLRTRDILSSDMFLISGPLFKSFATSYCTRDK